MNRSSFVVLVLCAVFLRCRSQLHQENGKPDMSSEDVVSSFRPSLTVVLGILSIMFFFTFILILYAKFCHQEASVHVDRPFPANLPRSASQLSGIDKTVIESLPLFRFSALKGSKEGLECAVCLARYEGVEVLRLLPKCKHAFHIGCIDRWLENHSSCPLCRRKIHPEDITVAESSSFRLFQNDERTSSGLELFVQREDSHHASSRFRLRMNENSAKPNDGEIPIPEFGSGGLDFETRKKQPPPLHRFNHSIIVSDIVFKNRWSNVNSSDLRLLDSEMILSTSSNRLGTSTDYPRIEEGKRTTPHGEISEDHEAETVKLYDQPLSSRVVSSPADQRSQSEITGLSRFRDGRKLETLWNAAENNDDDERRRGLWLPIAKRTARWFARRERNTDGDAATRSTAV